MKHLLALIYLVIAMIAYPTKGYSDNFSDEMAKLESNNNCSAVNRFGYLGKYQFGKLALVDLGYKDNKGKWIGKDNINSTNDFLNKCDIQDKAFEQWRHILSRYLANYKVLSYIGTKFKDIKITKQGLIAASHLVGAYAVSQMLKTGNVPKDGNGVKATRYLKHFE